MKRNHTGVIVIFFILMFVSTYGETIESILRSGTNLDTALAYGFASTLLGLLITSAIMMALPFICSLIKQEKLPAKGGKAICLWNSILLFILPIILFGDKIVGGVSAIFFYFINKWLFVDKTAKDDYYLEDDPNRITECKSCGYQNKDYFEACPNCGKYAKRYIYLTQTPVPGETPIRFCRKCGNSLDESSQFCTACGTSIIVEE